jgi:hypothetical protein
MTKSNLTFENLLFFDAYEKRKPVIDKYGINKKEVFNF